MIISSAALAATISNVCDKLNVELPAGFTAALAAGRALPRAADELAGSIDKLHAAALDALAAGVDPATDKAVQRFAIHRALADSGLRQAAEQRAGEQIRSAIAEYSDAIIAVWADAISDDCDVLQSAATELHDLADLSAADHTMLRHSGKLVLWADASGSADRADHALRGVEAILAALAVDRGKSHRPLMLAPDMELEAFTAIAGRDKPSAWTVARTGTPLRLANVGEYTAAIGRITAAQRERQRQAEADLLAAQRAHRGAAPLERIG